MTKRILLALAATSALASTPARAQAPAAAAPRPAAITVEVVPPVPAELAARTRPYMELRAASFAGWNVRDRSMLIRTRFGDVPQFHRVAGPLMDRRQITFELEPVAGSWSPTGDMLLVSKDRGGDEFFQAYRLDGGRLTLLTDGKSRNNLGAWSKDAKLVGYSSTRRNGADTDLYVMDPRDPKTDQLMAEVKGGGWSITAFAPGNGKALVLNNQQITNSDPYLLDLATRQLTPIGDHRRDIAYGAAEFASDGQLWILSDDGSDVQRLGRIDTATGKFTPVASADRWDIDGFDISDDGRSIAYTTNEAGISRLYLLDVASGRSRPVNGLPVGIVGGLEWAPWGELGFTFSSAQGTADAWSLNPANGKLTRWTRSETGGLDFSRNPSARLIEVKSFDGEPVSGFLYRPDPARFPGKRPSSSTFMVVPRARVGPALSAAAIISSTNSGLPIFYPNVRGSTGFGKRFVSLDNGPFKREDSVKDIGAFLTALKATRRSTATAWR
jgi:dipeptidyl aminopeptidase/acylaminoacyl peptidase